MGRAATRGRPGPNNAHSGQAADTAEFQERPQPQRKPSLVTRARRPESACRVPQHSAEARACVSPLNHHSSPVKRQLRAKSRCLADPREGQSICMHVCAFYIMCMSAGALFHDIQCICRENFLCNSALRKEQIKWSDKQNCSWKEGRGSDKPDSCVLSKASHTHSPANCHCKEDRPSFAKFSQFLEGKAHICRAPGS